MRLIVLLAVTMLMGCAGTDVARVANNHYKVAGKYSDDTADGIRYYESAAFLLVYSDGKGGLNSQLIFLPDLTQKRVIDPYSVLASNNSVLTFVNGVLTQSKTIADETVVPKAVVGALEKVAAAALAGTLNAAGRTPTGQLPPPQLFKIVINGGIAKLVGGPGVDLTGKVRMIDVTSSNPGKSEPPPPAQSAPSVPKKGGQ